MKISNSLEDYIEAISEIIEEKEHAHTKDIADKLHVKMPSATNALQTLNEKGLINYQSHTPVTLTPEGDRIGKMIRKRHQNLRKFFNQVLQIDEEKADIAACKVEHVIGDSISARLAFLSETIIAHEDCAKLRDMLNDKFANIDNEQDAHIPVSLADLEVGENAIIVRIEDRLKGIKKFADLGLIRGTFLTMEGRAPLGKLIRIRVLDSSLSIQADDAVHISVKKIFNIKQ